ncbi:protein IWS1 homolog 1-like [Curcuma longa]|uniref:protein IWS1 homolog 1-like n=1 Tax=Curcuma longa TaxID=136217 RepID=UPI003D9ECE3B
MGYDDPYMDEDGEPLMDPDAASDREFSPEPALPVDDDDEDEGDWGRRDRSPTPVMNSTDDYKSGKPKKRLVKRGRESSPGKSGSPATAFDEEWLDAYENEDSSSKKKMKSTPFMKEGKGGSLKKNKEKLPSSFKADRFTGQGSKSGSKGYGGGSRGGEADPEEEEEMWKTVAGGDSEDDQEGIRTVDDDNFIDDSGVDPADRYGSDNEHSVRNAPQAEEGEEDEVKQLFKGGKKKKKNEKSPAEIALIVEHLIAELEVTAEEDAELNRQNKPATNKLRKLSLLVEVLSKKKLQQEFLDHGVLTLLKNWLEPLPDGSLPTMNIRSAILKLLSDFPIDLEQFDRREQLKKSGLGKVIMFLSKSDEETTANRKLAKELVDKWSRPIFNKSTRFEDMRRFDDDRVPYRRPPSQKQVAKSTAVQSREDDLDLPQFSQGRKTGISASRQHASRPEAMSMDFVVRPQSKVDPEEVRARAKQVIQDQRRINMHKKLQKLKAPKKKQLQASKLSVEGRGMVKYL